MCLSAINLIVGRKEKPGRDSRREAQRKLSGPVLAGGARSRSELSPSRGLAYRKVEMVKRLKMIVMRRRRWIKNVAIGGSSRNIQQRKLT
jgi:hypothetical protein